MCSIWLQKIIAKSGVILYISMNLFLIPDICFGVLSGSALLQRMLIFNQQNHSGPGAPSAKRLVRTSHTAITQSFLLIVKNTWRWREWLLSLGDETAIKWWEHRSVYRMAHIRSARCRQWFSKVFLQEDIFAEGGI